MQNKRYFFFKGLFFPNLIHAVSTRAFQNMSLAYGDTLNSLPSRQYFLQGLNIDYRSLVCAQQIHSSHISYVSEKDKGKGALSPEAALADTDALMTDRINLPLAIFTADCLSIFIYDAETPAIALIHAGWRGTRENIMTKTVNMMKNKFNSQVKNLYVGFAPAIRECCYEVGEEFKDFFSYGLAQKNNRYYLDLVGINNQQALDSGVREDNVFDSRICTFCRCSEFFSFRREGSSSSRMMSVIMLV